MSIISFDFNQTSLWKLALWALVQIGTFVDQCDISQKALSYTDIVVQKMLSLVHVDDSTLSFSLKLEAVFEIGASGRSHMLKIIQGLEETVLASLSDVYVCPLIGQSCSFKIYWNILSVKKLTVSLDHFMMC